MRKMMNKTKILLSSLLILMSCQYVNKRTFTIEMNVIGKNHPDTVVVTATWVSLSEDSTLRAQDNGITASRAITKPVAFFRIIKEEK